MPPEPVLSVTDVRQHLATPSGLVRAVDGVSFTIAPRETLGLVGESGCGKSTLARTVTGLLAPSSGEVRLSGRSVEHQNSSARRERAALVQMVFQDPFGSLNPRLSVGRIVEEPLLVHGRGDRAARRARMLELLDRVGLPAAAALRFPHELSGGQRQRVAIARALALEPRLIVCDEPVSALDVSIQAQVLNLLADLQRDLGLSYLFISHDLSVVRHIADRIAVMYLGRIVEIGPAAQVLSSPVHPYTRTLLAALPPESDAAEWPRAMADADVPSALAIPEGCRFRPRCTHAFARCAEEPALIERTPSRAAACWRDLSEAQERA